MIGRMRTNQLGRLWPVSALTLGGGGIGGNGGWLLGQSGTNGPFGAGPMDGRVSLSVFNGIAPTSYISVNNGPYVPVLVDTGSTGLVIPWWQIGLQNLGIPTGYGISAYSGGLIYFYLTFHVPINFGNGVVTAPTYVDVPIISVPTTLDRFFAGNYNAAQNYVTAMNRQLGGPP